MLSVSNPENGVRLINAEELQDYQFNYIVMNEHHIHKKICLRTILSS